MIKSITIELTIITQVVVDIHDSWGDDVTPAGSYVNLVTWNSSDIQKQIQQHLDDNIEEIIDEA